MSIGIHKLTAAWLVALGVLMLGALPARAAGGGLAFLSSFNGSDDPSFPQGFTAARVAAVNQANHNVYITNQGPELIGTFSATGVFQSQFAARGPAGIALDESTGELIVADGGQDTIKLFSATGMLLAEWNGGVTPSGSFGNRSIAVAVDNSALPSKGHVYVTDNQHNVVDLLNTAGSPVSFSATAPYISGSQLTGIPQQSFRGPLGIAVDRANGDIYVYDNAEAVDVFAPSGEYLFQLTGGSFTQGFDAIAVDGTTGEVYLSDSQEGLEVFSAATGALQDQVLGTPGGPFAQLTGVAVDEGTGELYAVDRRPEGGVVDIFGPGPLPAVANTDPASAVTATSAVLHGDLNPEGVNAGYFFRYGKGASCGGERVNPGSAGAGSTTVHEEAAVTGLEPATQYTFCFYTVVGQSVGKGAPQTFETTAVPPAIGALGLSATSLSRTEEALLGTVNPNNKETTYYFEYGTTTAYGSTSSAPPGTGMGAGFGDREVRDVLTGLAPSTTYHYRLVAINAAGESVGASDQTFTTEAPPPAASTGEASEVVYDAATVSGAVVPGSVGTASDTRWCVEYGAVEDPGYVLGSVPSVAGDAGQGNAAVPVSVRLSGLTPGGSYRYRVVAVNSVAVLERGSDACGASGAQEADGAEGTFTTPLTPAPPSVATGAASAIEQNTASITGTVDAEGTPTSWAFQIGIDTSYGVQIFGETLFGSEAQTISLPLQDLQPGTTYHYRLMASSAGGTVYGADATFTTATFPSASITAPLTAPLIAMPELAFPSVPGEAKVGASQHKRKPAQAKKKRAGKRRSSGKSHKKKGKASRLRIARGGERRGR
jgi:hypothetical protein